ncbi:hypothetical protein C8R45DRAFT_1143455 [Mycena sanguinolenta]|nr:hypothetical protein C8R45DRAFT_1143455 [Mycena sanguinolenta]
MKGYRLLDAGALETLACRMAHFDIKWENGLLAPICNWRLYLPQSITWLRLVAGTWLFVASSDNYVSKISCWDLTSRGCEKPLAEAYLPGRVKTGKPEVQDCVVVLALGLGPESSAVHVITLRKHSGGHAFSELARIESSSHVLMLCGNLIGCAVRNGAIVPHIVDWKNDQIRIIPELDIPGRRSVSHLMTIRKNVLVMLRATALQIYTLGSTADDSVTLVKEVEMSQVWEAAVCNPVSDSSPVYV